MIKFPFLFSISLFLLNNVFGQTDSNAAARVKDTAQAGARPVPRGKEGDTDRQKTDSGFPPKTDTARAATKKIIKKTAPPGKKDSSGAQSITGSITRKADTASAGKTGPADLQNAEAGALQNAKAGALQNAEAAVRQKAGNADSRKEGTTNVRREGPDERFYWKSLLARNTLYNFTGKPVVQKEQVHRPESKDSLFYLLLGILFYFAFFRIFFEKYFSNLLTLFFRVSLRQQQIREQVLQTPLPSLLLNLLFIITTGLFAAYLIHNSRMGVNLNFWILYLDCVMGLGLIYLAKFVLLKFCGWVFNISRATDIYIFIVFLVNKMVGIFLLPLLILIIFSGPEIRDVFVTVSLTMIFVLLGYRVFASYRPIRNEIKLTPFYFFLYLCAFEIAPLLLIYKVLLQYLEKSY